MSKSFSLVNGIFKKTISVYDRGLAYGDGIFETMLWSTKKIDSKKSYEVEYWKKHLERLFNSCSRIKLKLPSENLINQYKNKILEKSYENGLRKGVLKIIITRGEGARGYKFDINMKPTIIILSSPFNNSLEKDRYKNGVKVKICDTHIFDNQSLFGMKHLNRLDSVIARAEWDSEFYEGLFIDNNKNLLEGTMTNIFFVKNKVLFTPKLKSFGINGIMRQVIIEKANIFFKDLIEREIKLSEVQNFDSMFLSNSIIKVVPVKSLEKVNFKISNELKRLINFF